jgi:hypothetical protein
MTFSESIWLMPAAAVLQDHHLAILPALST